MAAAEATGLLVVKADAHRALAEVLHAAGRRDATAEAAARALALDEAKGNEVAAAATRRWIASLSTPA